MPEQLLTVDPVLRRFQYRITAPMFKEHLGTLDVHDLEDGTSLVVYSTDAEPGAPGPGHRRGGPGGPGQACPRSSASGRPVPTRRPDTKGAP